MMRILASGVAALAALGILTGCSTSGLSPGVGLSRNAVGQADFQSSLFRPNVSEYQQAVMNTKPLAYFSLDNLKSVGGKYSVKLVGGARLRSGGPIKTDPNNKSLYLRGKAYATTSLSGGIPGTGSMIAWVNLAQLPSKTGKDMDVCGESQSGNDFDVGFLPDNSVHFYTGSGENTGYTPDPHLLQEHWNMIAVTYRGGSNGFRDIYWNGKIAAPFHGAVDSSKKTTQFAIGESLVFTGRYFQGEIDAVAIWSRALTAKEIAAIYAAAQ